MKPPNAWSLLFTHLRKLDQITCQCCTCPMCIFAKLYRKFSAHRKLLPRDEIQSTRNTAELLRSDDFSDMKKKQCKMKKYKRNKSQQGQKNKLLITNFKLSEKLAKLKTPRNIIHVSCRFSRRRPGSDMT